MTDLRVCTACAAIASIALAAGAYGDGGDSYGTAVDISGQFPGDFTGDTSDNTDKGEEFCPYTGTGAPDEWYKYTAAEDMVWTFDLCASSYDTKVYVYDADQEFLRIGCNDDSTSCEDTTMSKLWAVEMVAGHHYVIVVDGYDSEASGAYLMKVTEFEGCEQTCPPEGIEEGEPPCGDEYVDEYNGGCNSDPPVFSEILCGDTICGQGGTFLFTPPGEDPVLQRDTDWYEVETDTGKNLTWTGIAEFPLQLLVIFGGDGSCDEGSYTIIASGQGDPCSSMEVVAEEVPPGLYWMWAGPSVFEDFWACPLDYVATLTCEDVEVCDVECPEGSTPEGEPVCYPNYEDVTNAGCNGSPPYPFGSVSCEETICGTSGTYTYMDGETQYTYRDTDWFEFETQYGGDFDWDGVGEFPLLLFIIDSGDGSCVEGSYTQLDSFVASDACQMAMTDVDGVGPGVYWFLAMPGDWEWYPCGVEYYATLTCKEDIPCDLDCAPGSTDEGEEQCYTDYVDEYNGGCYSDPPVFMPIALDETICGYTGTFKLGGVPSRDSDWYEYESPGEELTFSVIAETKISAYIVDAGSGDCSDYSIVKSATADECDVAEAKAEVEAGTYWLVVLPSASSGIPCDTLYNATLTGGGGVTCPADITGDGVVDVLDLLEVLSQWGGSGTADINGDGIVDVLDLLEVLGAWGECP